MITDVPAVPVVPDFIAHVETRLRRELAAAVEDWGHCVTALSHWEDEHLLENPSAELLARHKHTTERLLRFGRFLALATEQAEFPDQPVAQAVAATQRCLQRLTSDALSKQPGVSYDQLMAAVHPRYVEFRRARRRPPTLAKRPIF